VPAVRTYRREGQWTTAQPERCGGPNRKTDLQERTAWSWREVPSEVMEFLRGFYVVLSAQRSCESQPTFCQTW